MYVSNLGFVLCRDGVMVRVGLAVAPPPVRFTLLRCMTCSGGVHIILAVAMHDGSPYRVTVPQWPERRVISAAAVCE